MSRTTPRLCVLVATLVLVPKLAGAAPPHVDPTFGSDGFVEMGFLQQAVAVQPGGAMIVAGCDGNGDFALARFTAAGVLDPTFASGGYAVVDLTGGRDIPWQLVFQPDDKIVAVGEVEIDDEEGLGAVRFDADGALDPSFGSGGVAVADVGFEPYSAALQSDGKLVFGGVRKITEEDTVFALARLAADGTLDPSFGSGGVVYSNLLPGERQSAWRVAVQSDDKIIAVGVGGNKVVEQDFLIARYASNGALDVGFGNGGLVRVVMSPSQDIAYDVVIQPDGKILVTGGYYPQPASIGYGVVRLLPNGALDPGFGDGGIVRTPFSVQKGSPWEFEYGGYAGAYARALALLPDGGFVVAGGWGIARYHADGSLDPTFGGGAITTGLADGGLANYRGVALQADGKAIAVGTHDAPDGVFGATTGLITRYAPCTCPACEVCDGAGGCVVAPATGCRGADETALTLTNSPDDRGDSLGWKWSHGPVTPALALGFPYGATDYAVCVYDESGPTPTVAIRGSLPAGPACNGVSCWRMAKLHDGAKFRNKGAGGPITQADIKFGTVSSAAKLKGKGAALGMPALPLATPFRLQIQAENGSCWETLYQAGNILGADAHKLKAATP